MIALPFRSIIKLILGLTIFAFTCYVLSHMFQYFVLLCVCLLLIIVISLLAVHIDGYTERVNLSLMTIPERQSYHAQRLYFFTMSPTNHDTVKQIENQNWKWLEWKFKQLIATKLSNDIPNRQPFIYHVNGFTVHDGLPSMNEVEQFNDTIVLHVRDNWSGLFSRINPWLNTFLNRFLGGWNLGTEWMIARLSRYSIPYPTVCIDLPTADVANLNFGQKDDCLMLDYCFQLIRQKYPGKRILIVSVCLGALRVLNWLTRLSSPDLHLISGVVLESPLPSVKHLLMGSLQRYYTEELYQTFCLIVPHFRAELEEHYSFFRPFNLKQEQAHKINIPIFIGLLTHDPFCNSTHAPLFVERFSNITFFISSVKVNEEDGHKLKHGKLFRLPEFQEAVHNFLNKIK